MAPGQAITIKASVQSKDAYNQVRVRVRVRVRVTVRSSAKRV